MEVYFEDSDYDIPEIEVEIVLVLANFGSVDYKTREVGANWHGHYIINYL